MKALNLDVGIRTWKPFLDGLTSLSVKPLQLANYAGIILITFGFSYLLAMLLLKVFSAAVICGVESEAGECTSTKGNPENHSHLWKGYLTIR
ncbi:hypothetical protein [Desulfosporosinus hippei]|uniref:Uncharacterized protein n=1 Tax=Desulfosporosinus hippei DSM 8344 TaxID=1121419 RepID=A0A1G8JBW3_9FIRM|nr:hypothetical protein [Desulfosporosinus hippei]SDI28110.1 hypothetical protein SAMN05443529_1328 [Desulfosporosinus hippei DSM 8344]